MKKPVFYTELAYLFGMFILALGTAFMEAADFGVSMVVAPAYLVYLKVSQFLPFFTFGMAEYTLQAVLLILLILVLRQFRPSYLFSFVTAVLYGLILDLNMLLVALIPCEAIAVRLIFYFGGMLLCAIGVSMLFHTYISPEVYELFVKEASAKYNISINKFKTAYDCISCGVAILMSFAFFGFGHFEGVKWGTVVCALLNGWLIGRWSGLLDRAFEFADRLKGHRYFEK